MKRLLSVSVRTHWTTELFWSIEFVFCKSPLPSTHHREQGSRRTVHCMYEYVPADQMSKTADQLLDDWTKIVYLYSIVDEFARQYKSGKWTTSS